MRTMAVGKFTAMCLAVIDEVRTKREPEPVPVTKNGKPVAKLVPLAMPEGEDPLDAFLFPGAVITDEVMSPMYSDEEYEEFYKHSAEQLRDTPR